VKAILLSIFSGLVILIYSERGWGQLNEIIRIPLIDYILVFVLAGIFWAGLKITEKVREASRKRVEA
ncbi:MAG: hypothetical protein KF893_10015, partial [Caldilineaceae bacterium]|nr:hypothetical protein [Caldilineaceae bacterium]